jgi:deazaflavin-dependent oxidoreductase (nitroreductase family)
MSRVLVPLHRAFIPLNALAVPALEAGFGALFSNPATGYLMVLRTRGRRTGKMRTAPLGYVILDGAIYCCAGFGRETAWYRNLLADSAVEVVLPGRTLIGMAADVTDSGERARAYRALIASLGGIGRMALGDLQRLDDETLLAEHAAIPLVRIVPTGVVAGPLDPGGRFWIAALIGWIFAGITLASTIASVRRLLPALVGRHLQVD